MYVQYVDWVDTNDPEAEWKAEAECSTYVHTNGVDLFKGASLMFRYDCLIQLTECVDYLYCNK